MALALDHLGVAHGWRVAIVSPNSATFLTSFFGVSGFGRVLVPVNFRLSAAEIALHRRALGASVLLYDPDLADVVGGIPVRHRFALDGVDDAGCSARPPRAPHPGPWAAGRTPPARSTTPRGRPPGPRGSQLTHRNCWLNAVTFGWHTGVGDRDVLLHTLPMFHCNGWGMPYAVTGMGGRHIVLRKVDGEEILGARRAARGDPAVRGAGRGRRHLGCGGRAADAGAAIPGAGTVRIVVAGRAAAVQDDRTGRDRARLGVHPDLRPDRDRPLLTINRAPGEWDEVTPASVRPG